MTRWCKSFPAPSPGESVRDTAMRSGCEWPISCVRACAHVNTHIHTHQQLFNKIDAPLLDQQVGMGLVP